MEKELQKHSATSAALLLLRFRFAAAWWPWPKISVFFNMLILRIL
ncbi:hypothetical protein [Lactobacillus nasalidis]|nr:hypothetical protein [Lactobacillus nasalidis]